MRTLGLDVGGRDNLSGDVKPLAEVVETLGGEGVVVVLPREAGLQVAPGGEGLASLDDLEGCQKKGFVHVEYAFELKMSDMERCLRT